MIPEFQVVTTVYNTLKEVQFPIFYRVTYICGIKEIGQ